MPPPPKTSIMRRIRHLLAKLTLRSTKRRECAYCCEAKRARSFNARILPPSCRAHLSSVCKSCVRASLGAQLDSRPLLGVGCPQCSLAWSGEYLRVLLGYKDKKRYKQLDLLARGMSFVPVEMPEMESLDLMLKQGARFCPWCRFAFIKDGGCDYMSCTRCGKGFQLSYALVLEDGMGRRAADVPEEWDAVYEE